MFMSVDLPEPEAPMMATKSPAAISIDTSRSACTTMSPMVKVRTRCSPSMMLLIAERLDGIHVGGLARRIEAEGNSHQRREQKRQHDGAGAHHGGPAGEVRNEKARRQADNNAGYASGQRQSDGLDQKLAQNVACLGAHRLAETDLFGALGDRQQHNVHDAHSAHDPRRRS